MDSGFQVMDSSLSEWNLDSGFQSLVGFQILCELYSGFQSQGFRNPQANFPGFRNTASLTWGEKQGLAQSVSARRPREKIEEHLLWQIPERCTRDTRGFFLHAAIEK